MSLYDIARRVTDEVLPPVVLERGKFYIHPEHGIVQIIDGMYRDPIHNRISNFWTWKIIETGEMRDGYGGQWQQVTPASSEGDADAGQ